MKKHLIILTLLFGSIGLANCSEPGKNTNGAPAETAAAGGTVYLRTVMWSGSLSISWVYLGKDGVIIMDPKHGVDPVNVAAEKADNASNTGTYKIAGNKLMVNWQDGKTAALGVEYNGKELSSIDGGIVSKQPALPANYRISGQYAARAATANLSASSTLVFAKDGTFTRGNFGGVNTGYGTSTSQSDAGGTYNITGNTLTLTFKDGKKTKSVITIMEMGKRYLVIDGSSYPQEK